MQSQTCKPLTLLKSFALLCRLFFIFSALFHTQVFAQPSDSVTFSSLGLGDPFHPSTTITPQSPSPTLSPPPIVTTSPSVTETTPTVPSTSSSANNFISSTQPSTTPSASPTSTFTPSAISKQKSRSTSSSVINTTSQTPSSIVTPSPSSTTSSHSTSASLELVAAPSSHPSPSPVQTTPLPRTSLVATGSVDQDVSGPSPSASTVVDGAANPDPSTTTSGFMHNTTAVVSTFTVLGLAFIGGTFFLVMWFMRRRRRQQDLLDDEFIADEHKRFGGMGAEYGGDVSFGNIEKQPELDALDEESALGHSEMQHATYDPFQNSHPLVGPSIIPDEYRLSLLERAQMQQNQAQGQNIAGQMQMHYDYGTTSVPPHAHAGGNRANVLPSSKAYQNYGSTVDAGSQYPYSHPYAMDAYSTTPDPSLSQPLHRQPSGGASANWGVAC